MIAEIDLMDADAGGRGDSMEGGGKGGHVFDVFEYSVGDDSVKGVVGDGGGFGREIGAVFSGGVLMEIARV